LVVARSIEHIWLVLKGCSGGDVPSIDTRLNSKIDDVIVSLANLLDDDREEVITLAIDLRYQAPVALLKNADLVFDVDEVDETRLVGEAS
jgi:flagellin-specific chaperone FliS